MQYLLQDADLLGLSILNQLKSTTQNHEGLMVEFYAMYDKKSRLTGICTTTFERTYKSEWKKTGVYLGTEGRQCRHSICISGKPILLNTTCDIVIGIFGGKPQWRWYQEGSEPSKMVGLLCSTIIRVGLSTGRERSCM
jgi:hypothetical protein